MINYWIETLKYLLSKERVTIVDEIDSYHNGKFIHILDIEGNKIELWKPNNKMYGKIVGGINK